jgi:hypothetical protein
VSDPFSSERKTGRLKKQNLFGSGYAGLGVPRIPSVLFSLFPEGEA